MSTSAGRPGCQKPKPRIAIIGGGLAGLAAATALAGLGLEVELFEARRRLGGRAASYRDAHSGELVDLCQHVAMGCCVNWLDFCRRTGIVEGFYRETELAFFGPDNEVCRFAGSRWLPAPLHLGPALGRLRYLSPIERRRMAMNVWRLARSSPHDDAREESVAQWLLARGETARTLELFWGGVLVSALGETLERASRAAARKVFLDGFLSSRESYTLYLPLAPLDELYDNRVARALADRGVAIRRGCRVKQIVVEGTQAESLILADGDCRDFDAAIVALPWRLPERLFAGSVTEIQAFLAPSASISPSPITSVHVWYDRPINELRHAVIVGRLSQWIFRRDQASQPGNRGREHYYQVVISGSRQLAGRRAEDIAGEVHGDLASLWPDAAAARLVRYRVVTHPEAVFSVGAGTEQLRPSQRTPIKNLALAGDWTATGWPATMESAVRSGYLAAGVILDYFGMPARPLVPEPRRNWLTRLLLSR